MASGDEEKVVRQLVQNLRSDLSLLSNEAKKKYPAVKEAAERGAMKLKSVSEAPGFTLEVLAGIDDVVYPLLYACDSKNPKIVQIALTSLQRLIPNGAIPEKNLESTVAALQGLVDAGVEELRVIQTVFLMASVQTFIKGKVLVKILVLCFGLYKSRDASVHSTAGVAIRQIVVALFDKLSNQLREERGQRLRDGEEEVQELPAEATDAYLLFQDVCFLTNGDPPAWLPNTLEIEVNFGLELLEVVLRQYPAIFVKERLFSLLLTERVCPLIIKLFSPSSKYRLSSMPATAVPGMDKPTFGLSVRLLRILNILIKDFFTSLVTQCEIFLSMLVRFLDSDKPMWQRTLAIEIFHSFCNQPHLFKLFCESYDMQEHSSKIFGDIINALGAFIQSTLTSNPATQFPFTVAGVTAAGTGGGAMPVPIAMTTGDRPMHLFVVRGFMIQAESLPSNAHQKPTYLEMLDKSEVPTIPDGYPLVVGMTALLDAVGSVASIVNDDTLLPSSEKPGKGVKETMLSSSWSGALVAITHLLDACGDEDTIQMILDAHQTCIRMCGFLKMDAPRDAYLLALCRASLPPRYAPSLVTPKLAKAASEGSERGSEGDAPSPRSNTFSEKRSGESSVRKKTSDMVMGGGGDGAEGSGTPPQVMRSLAGGQAQQQQTNLGQQQQQLSAKSLQCIKTLLQLIERDGGVVGTAWLLIMTTVQHLLHLFGVSPVSTEVVQSSRADSLALSVVTVEKKGEVAEIVERLSVVNIFKSSKQLSDEGLMCLLSALCTLSEQAVLGTANKDAELFPLSSLEVVGENNLHRLKLIWSPIIEHLCKVCMCSDSTFRIFGSESLTTLIRKALEHTSKADQRKTDEEKADFHMMLISPLQTLSAVPHNDVRQKQLDCVGQVLQSRPQALHSSWNVVLGIISAAASLPSDVLVRSGFQSLQVIITDFLPTIPTICVPTCVEVAGYYGLQAQDINVSLTSIGLLWSIADYLFQNKTKVTETLEALKEGNKLPPTPSGAATRRQSSLSGSPVAQSPVRKTWRNASLTVFDSVWMFLFRQLADLCVDERAAVRKSASQTLFSTISAHGTLLRQESWHAVLSQILFPLLDQVSMNTDAASTSSLQTQALLIHHSRDTARKQWAETEVLTLNGVARLFQTRWPTLVCLEGFDVAWGTLLEFIKSCAQSLSNEVSEAALKSFHTILVAPPPIRVRSTSVVKSSPPPGDQVDSSRVQEDSQPLPSSSSSSEGSLWEKAWKAWLMIGMECVCKRLPPVEKFKVFLNRTPQTKEESDSFFSSVPSQSILIYLVQLFPAIYSRVRSKFTQSDFQEAARILYTALIMPVSKDTSPFLVPSYNEHMLNSLQKDILKAMATFFTRDDVFDHEDSGPQTLFGKKTELIDTKRRIEVTGEQSATPLFPLVIAELLKYGLLVTNPPDMVAAYHGIPRPPIMTVNYVPFSLSATGLVVLLYSSGLEGKVVPIPPGLSVDCLKALRVPLKLKYRCVQPVVWMYSLDALLAILRSTLPQLLSKGDSHNQFWNELASIFEDFLFNDIPDGMELPMEKSSEYEAHDIKLVEMIKKDILPTSTKAPKDFLEKLTAVLNRGSIHSIADHYEDNTTILARVPFREKFARSCFEALLQFSFLHSQDSNIDPTSQLALNALLERCKEVLAKFVHEERLSGQCPLPRSRMNEVSLVLKSVSVLISSLKEAQRSSAKVDKSIWKQVVLLYPALVQCVTCHSMEVRAALKEVLSQFSELIKP